MGPIESNNIVHNLWRTSLYVVLLTVTELIVIVTVLTRVITDQITCTLFAIAITLTVAVLLCLVDWEANGSWQCRLGGADR